MMKTSNTVKAILDFVTCHTIAIERCLPVADRAAGMPVIDRLLRRQILSEWQHRSGLRYWTAPSTEPLSDTSLTRALGILLFCCQASRSVVTKAELESCFPTLFRHGLPAGHYVQRDAKCNRLGHVRVDAGQSKINRIVVRSGRLIHRYRQQAGFRELIDAGQFELTWIFPTPSKQSRLSEALQCCAGSGVRVRVVAIPELLNVVAPIPPLPQRTQ